MQTVPPPAAAGNPAQPQQIVDRLLDMLDRLEYEQARELARNGNYLAAQNILLNLLRRQPSASGLDLLARVYAQQGLFNEARSAWERAAALDPSSPEIAAGLACLAGTQLLAAGKRESWLRGAAALVVLLVVLLSVMLLMKVDLLTAAVAQLRQSSAALPTLIAENRPAPTSTPGPTAVPLPVGEFAAQNAAILAAVQNNQQALQDLSGKMGATAAPTAAPAPTLTPFSLAIEVPGVQLTSANGAVQIAFSDKLFLYDSLLSTQAEAVIRQVGLQLEPYMGKVQVQVTGYTDVQEKGLASLPYERALAVVRYLNANTRLPANMFTLASGEGQPSPPAGLNQPFRDRTVILTVFPIAGKD